MKNKRKLFHIFCRLIFSFVCISDIFGWGAAEPVPDYFNPNYPPYLQPGSSSSSGQTSSSSESSENTGNSEHKNQSSGNSSSGNSSSGNSSSGNSSSGSSSSGSSSSGSSSSGSSSSGSSSSGSSSSQQQEADRKAKEEADRLAKEEADRKAEEERLAKEEADRKAKEEAERLAKEEADRKAEEERLARIREQEKQERDSFTSSVTQSQTQTDKLSNYDRQITSIQTTLTTVKQKLAYGAAAMTETDRNVLINQANSLSKELDEAKERKSTLIGDPVYIATGQYADSQSDVSIRYMKKSFDVSRTYTTSDSKGSFGKNWFSSLDERLIFGIWGITDTDCSNFYQNTVAVTESILTDLKSSFTGQFGLNKDSWDTVIPKIEAERNSIYDIQKKLQEQKTESERLCQYYEGTEYYQSMLSLHNQIISLISQTDNRIRQYTELITKCVDTVTLINDFQAELTKEKHYYDALFAKSNEDKKISTINTPALFSSGSPEYYRTIGTDKITLIDGSGSSHIFTQTTQSAATNAPETLAGTVWKADSDTNYVSLRKMTDGYSLLFSDGSRHIFSTSGLLTRIYDAYGNYISFIRNDAGKLDFISTSCGRLFSVHYSGEYITSITAENDSNQSVSFGYTNDRLTSVTDSFGDTTRYSWNNGLLSGIIKPDGSSITFSFEATGPDGKLLTTATTNEEGFSEHFEYDFIRRTTLHTDHSGVQTLYSYDADFNTAGINYADGMTVHMDSDDAGNIILKNINGDITRYEYDDSGRTSRILYSDGSSEYFMYDSAGNLLSYTERDGTKYDYLRNNAGDIIEKRINGVTCISCHYAPNGLADYVSVIDDTVNTTYFEYDVHGNMIKALSGDCTEEWVWDSEDNLLAYKHNGITEKEYFRQGRTVTEKNVNGLITSTVKNERKDTVRIEETDSVTGEWRVTEYEFDRRHLVTAVWQGDGSVQVLKRRYRYDGEGRQEAAAVYRGDSAVIQYFNYTDENGIKQADPVSISFFSLSPEDVMRFNLVSHEGFSEADLSEIMLSASETYTESYNTRYLTSGQTLITCISPRGYRTETLLDPWGNVLSITDELGIVSSSTENAQPKEGGQQINDCKTYSYSEDRRTITVTEGDYYTTTYTLNAWGEITSVTDGNGNCTLYKRDCYGNITSITDPYGNITAFEYNQDGKQTKRTYADGSWITFTYDITGNICQVDDASGIQFIRKYDAEGNLIHSSGRDLSDYDFEYDARNRLCKITENGCQIWHYDYLDDGRFVKRTDAKGNSSLFEYNTDGTLIAEIDRNGIIHYADKSDGGFSSSVSKVIKDESGNLLEIIDDNTHLMFLYDDAGFLIRQKNINSGSEVFYTYDKAGNRIEMSEGARRVNYTYGKNNELLAVRELQNGFTTAELSFEYDCLGREISRTWQNGEKQVTTYDKDGNVTLVIRRDSSGKLIFGEGFLYDSNGRMTAEITSSGTITLPEYDSFGRLICTYVTATDEAVRKEREEAVFYGLISPGSTNSVESSALYLSSDIYYALQSYLNQMMNTLGNSLSVLQNVIQTEYTYDECSNRISKTTSYGTVYYGYDAENRMISAGNHTLSYDDSGNLLSDVSPYYIAEYEYSAENRMTGASILDSVQNSSILELYDYDALGRRITENSYEKMMNGTYLHKTKKETEYDGFSFDIQKTAEWKFN